jgi:hypothetical protein
MCHLLGLETETLCANPSTESLEAADYSRLWTAFRQLSISGSLPNTVGETDV